MSQLMDLLRGPALGVIFMILLLAGVLLITAFAALMAQMGLLFRMKSWNTSEKQSQGQGSGTGNGTRQQEPYRTQPSVRETRGTYPVQGMWLEPNSDEVVEAVWREVVQ
jgi:hypothetical protein